MWKLLVLLTLSSCMLEKPVGVEVDADRALGILLTFHRNATPAPPVFMVPRDPACEKNNHHGFIDPNNGKCVGGVFINNYDLDRTIFILENDDGLFSVNKNLSHEVAHFVGYEHPDPGNWPADSAIGAMVTAGNELLIADPEADRIRLR
jgi:hypothetical protein